MSLIAPGGSEAVGASESASASLIAPDFDVFSAHYRAGHNQIVSCKILDDVTTPVGALLGLGAEKPGTALLESVSGGETRGRYSILVCEPMFACRIHRERFEISATGSLDETAFASSDQGPADPLQALRAQIATPFIVDRALPPAASSLLGYLSYDMVRRIEKLPAQAPDPLGLPEALFFRPRLTAIFDSVHQEIVLTTPVMFDAGIGAQQAYSRAMADLNGFARALTRGFAHAPIASQDANTSANLAAPSEPRSQMAPEQFHAMVERSREYIQAGDIFQVVTSQRFEQVFALSPLALYRSLRRLNPSPFLYFLNLGAFQIVGASPEILVRLRDGKVTLRPIAGTAPRGADRVKDAQIEAALLADPKERAEHLMLLDLGRNDVGRVAKTGSVQVTQAFGIERYSHVMHVVSNIEGELADGEDAFSALMAGFPAGTLSGAPKVRAMEIIAQLEPHQRGVYGGGIGYFGADGSMDMAITLRTAVVKQGKIYVQAGSGIVLDSDPELERQESVHKSRAVFRAAAEAWRFA